MITKHKLIMKRYFIFLVLLVSSLSISAQRCEFSMNKSISASIGYSYVYKPAVNDIDIAKNLMSFDLNIYGVYAGVAYGENTLYREYGYGYDTYSENLNTYIFRIGPSFKIGNYNTGLMLTPYVGLMVNTYSENYRELYYDYYYRDYNSYDYTLWEESYDHSLVYGIKISYHYNLFEIGTHISNREFGVTVGFNVDMSF